MQGPRPPRQPELERRRRPDLAARQPQLQVRLPDAADLAPADEPVRRARSSAPRRRATRRRRPPPAIPSRPRCWACPPRSGASCPTRATSTSTPRRCPGYVQDQWALKPNLTLNLGLRYDYVTRAIGHGDAAFQSGPDLKTGEWLLAPRADARRLHAGAAAALPARAALADSRSTSSSGPPASATRSSSRSRTTGDRASAWPGRSTPSTVLRTGYALMWDSMVSRSQYGQHQFETWGWPQFSGIDTGTINTESGRDPADRGRPDPAVRRAPRRALEQHRVLQRSRPQERLLAPVARRGCRGSSRRNLMVGARLRGQLQRPHGVRRARRRRPTAAGDRPPPAGRLTAAERNQLRPWPHIDGTFTYSDDIGMSKYNSLQLKVQRRFAERRRQHVVLHLVEDDRHQQRVVRRRERDRRRRRRRPELLRHRLQPRGCPSYDIPHILTWATRLGAAVRAGEALARRRRRVLDPRQLAAQLDGAGAVRAAVHADRGRRSGQPRHHRLLARRTWSAIPSVDDPTVDRCFNPAAFAIPVNEFGNAERNSLRAPGFWNVDLGLQKNVRARRQQRAAGAGGGVQRLQPHQLAAGERGRGRSTSRPPSAGSRP